MPPFMTNGKRDYRRELEWEKKKKPNRVKDRAQRNGAIVTGKHYRDWETLS